MGVGLIVGALGMPRGQVSIETESASPGVLLGDIKSITASDTWKYESTMEMVLLLLSVVD